MKAIDESVMTLREFWKNYIYSAIKNIDASWHEVTRSCMNGVWKELCPCFVEDFTDFGKIQEQQKVVNNLLSMSEKLELNLEEQDFTDFFHVYAKELTNDELRGLEKQRKEMGEAEEEDVEMSSKHFETKIMAEAFASIEAGLALFKTQDPNEEWHMRVSAAIQDALRCYRIIYDEKKSCSLISVSFLETSG